MEIIINTLIALATIQAWLIIGFLMLKLIDDFESTDSEILTCFCWPLIFAAWVEIRINELIDKVLK